MAKREHYLVVRNDTVSYWRCYENADGTYVEADLRTDQPDDGVNRHYAQGVQYGYATARKRHRDAYHNVEGSYYLFFDTRCRFLKFMRDTRNIKVA